MTDDIKRPQPEPGASHDPAPAEPSGETEPPERDTWRDAQDDPWQPDEQAPPPIIGE